MHLFLYPSPEGNDQSQMNSMAPNQNSKRNLEKRSNTATTLGDYLYGETSDTKSDTRKRIEHPQPLPPVRPDSLMQKIQLSAIKFIACGGFICYLLGRFGFNVFFGFLLAISCAWTYWNVGREAKKGIEWQLEKQEGMRTVGFLMKWLLAQTLNCRLALYIRRRIC
jgi:Ca2+-dependent lipid-binding protein